MAYLMREDRSAWSGGVAEARDPLQAMRSLLQLRGYSARTCRLYLGWVERLLAASGTVTVEDIAASDVEEFLSSLAHEEGCSEGTWSQARAAIVFLFREVLHSDSSWLRRLSWVRPAAAAKLTLSRAEVRALLARLDGREWLLACLIYGSGLNLPECLRLTVHDIDLERGAITVRDEDGMPTRRTVLPRTLRVPLRLQIDHCTDSGPAMRSKPLGAASSEHDDVARVMRNTRPLFPSDATGSRAVQSPRQQDRFLRRAIERAARDAGLLDAITPRTLRDSFAAHLLQDGVPLWCVQALCGHARDTNPARRELLDLSATQSPLDRGES